MTEQITEVSGLTGNQLKLIAAAAMLLDHIGVIFFPKVLWLRLVGRLAYPIFAFMIAQGCRYTKNKIRYFVTMAGLAAGCQVVYYLFDKSLYMCILVTFSLSVLMIYALQFMKRSLSSESFPLWKKCIGVILFPALVLTVFLLNQHVRIDYGFWGSMVPVFVALFHPVQEGTKNGIKRNKVQLSCSPRVQVYALGAGLLVMALSFSGTAQYFSLFALPLLFRYSGKRGRWKMKYFFYLFYPLHLAVLELIFLLLKGGLQ